MAGPRAVDWRRLAGEPRTLARLPGARELAVGLFGRLFRRPQPSDDHPRSQHAVLIYIKLSDGDFGDVDQRTAIHQLCDSLTEGIARRHAGELDGDEFGGGECTLFMYGSDADALFSAVEPILRGSELCRGARVVKRYGEASDTNAREVTVLL